MKEKSRKYFMSRKSVLLIGGAGYLGQNLLEVFSARRSPLDITYAELHPLTNTEFKFLPIDVLSMDSVNALPDTFDIVINLVGQVSNPSNLSFRLNTEGVKNIIDYVKNSGSQLIHMSTLNVFGSSDTTIHENSAASPESPYAAFKLFAEYQISSFLDADKYSILRLSNLYASGQPKGILAYLLRSLHSDKKLFFNNNGDLFRHYLNVQDAANIVADVTEDFKPGIFNIVGPDFLCVKELIELVESYSGEHFEVQYTQVPPWENIKEVDDSFTLETLEINYKFTLEKFLKQHLKD